MWHMRKLAAVSGNNSVRTCNNKSHEKDQRDFLISYSSSRITTSFTQAVLKFYPQSRMSSLTIVSNGVILW